jgi:hypothetical protein
MEMRPQQQQKPPDTSVNGTSADKGSNELIKRIHKLRWMGLDDEAEGLQNELERRRGTAVDSVLAAPGETD